MIKKTVSIEDQAEALYQEAAHYAVTCAKFLSPPPGLFASEDAFRTHCDSFREKQIAHFLFPDLSAEEILGILDLRFRCLLLTIRLNLANPSAELDKEETTFTERRIRFTQSNTWKNLRPVQQEILNRVYLTPRWTHPDLRAPKKSIFKRTLKKFFHNDCCNIG
jgi:hypothetical protein